MYEKLIKIQSELKAPKGQYNNFGKYNYRNCEDILEALKPLLKEVGLFLTITDEVILIGDRYYIKATATVSDGTNKIETSALARESDTKKGMDDSQITGAASSYARKYALNGLFCIDDTKDADTTNKGDSKDKSSEETYKELSESPLETDRVINIEERTQLKAKLDGKTFAEIMNKYKNKVPLSKYNEIMNQKEVA